MTAKIESGLRTYFDDVARAAREGNPRMLSERMSAQGVAAVPADRFEPATLRKLDPPGELTPETSRELVLSASRYLPESYWSTVVMDCGTAGATGEVRDGLRHFGLQELREGRHAAWLAELGMIGTRLPPLPAFLNLLERLGRVSFIGSGDRRYALPPSPEAIAFVPRGPAGSLRHLMADGGELPRTGDMPGGLVRVAIVDTGIDGSHPALEGQIVDRIDLSMNQTGPVSPDGHGTHVGGIVAALPHRSVEGYTGVAPFAGLMDAQVWDPLGIPSIAVLSALGWALKKGADVVNLSMGAPGVPTTGDSLECRAIAKVSSEGVLVCVSAGNEGKDGEGSISVPGDAREAVTVAAVDSDGHWAPFSSMGPTDAPDRTGPKPTVAAPGVAIVSARSRYSMLPPLNGMLHYTVMNGTSMACPMISGVCAIGIAELRRQGHADAAPDLLVQALRETARDMHGEGPDRVGAGIVQVPSFVRKILEMTSRRQQTAHAAASPGGDAQAHPEGGIADPPTVHDCSAYREAENLFVEGVLANLKRFSPELAQELCGEKGAELDIGRDVHHFDDQQRIEDRALSNSLDPRQMVGLPLNREVWALIRKGGRPVLAVGVKSLAGWQALSHASGSGSGLKAEHIRQFSESIPGRVASIDRKGARIPCVLCLLAPDGWTEDLRSCAIGSGALRVVLCDRTDGGIADSGWRVDGAGNDPRSWCALHPVSLETRIQRSEALLLENLQIPGSVMGLPEAAECIGFPIPLTRFILATLCAGSAPRLHVQQGPDETIIKRRI